MMKGFDDGISPVASSIRCQPVNRETCQQTAQRRDDEQHPAMRRFHGHDCWPFRAG